MPPATVLNGKGLARRALAQELRRQGMDDVVIVGGGHNGLVAACYLAKAGYEVCVLERYGTVGGAAISEEIEGAPGHIASTGSYVLSLAPQKVLGDLDRGTEAVLGRFWCTEIARHHR